MILLCAIIILLGVAGTDYSVYASVPETSFDCNVQEFPGIYSDTEAECQVRYKIITKDTCTIYVRRTLIKKHLIHLLRSSTCANQMGMLTVFFVQMEPCLINNTSFVIGGTTSIARLNLHSMDLMNSYTQRTKMVSNKRANCQAFSLKLELSKNIQRIITLD